MMIKYRVHEVARDLNLNNKDIIDLLAQYTDGLKKHMTALTDEELSIIFEHYTQKAELKNFEEYYKKALRPEPVKKTDSVAVQVPIIKAEPVAPTEEKPVVTAAPEKPPVQAPPAPTVQTPIQNPPAAQKPVAPQPRPLVQQQRPQQQSQPRPAQPASQQPRPGDNRNAAPGQQQKPPFQQRPQQSQQSQQQKPSRFDRPEAQKPQNTPINTPPKQDIKKDQKHQLPAARPQAQKLQTAGMAEKSVTEVKTVDTRQVHVNLDRYNEKYEQIAPVGRITGEGQRKQKLSQKSAQRGKPFSSKRETEQDKLKKIALEKARKAQLKITIPDEITVGELASRLKVTAAVVIKKLMGLGVMAAINDIVDYDSAELVAVELGAKVEREVTLTIEERLIDTSEDTTGELYERSPVVVVMGHVDHGKTSLLDAIRSENVTATEAGGITQHIGAYRVGVKGREVTFLDTPGHEAFTSMRARGAQVTDIAILVVAADDGIMPQTVEAINHAKAAGVSIIVAINKMDKEGANPDRIKQELTEYELVSEEWGGDTICVPVSALKHEGIDHLLEMIVLVADMKELKANPNRRAQGTVIEARLDKGRGPVATILVQNGTLRIGDIVIAGTALGRVRAMRDDHGNSMETAGPSVPVEITGLGEVPSAGDIFNAVEDERLARELVDQRRTRQKEEQFSSYQKVTLENLFSQIEQGEVKELAVIVKGDVQGSVEAVRQSLEKLSNADVRVRVIHGGVGTITESDIQLANASNAIIVGFNVRPDPATRESAQRNNVDMRLYRIIYDCIEEISASMKGLLAPKFKDVDLGRIEVRQVYKITGVGLVAGSYVLDGKVTRGSSIRVVRDGIVVVEDKIDSLKRFKDDVREVAAGYECGVTLAKFADLKEGDIFEAYETVEVKD